MNARENYTKLVHAYNESIRALGYRRAELARAEKYLETIKVTPSREPELCDCTCTCCCACDEGFDQQKELANQTRHVENLRIALISAQKHANDAQTAEREGYDLAQREQENEVMLMEERARNAVNFAARMKLEFGISIAKVLVGSTILRHYGPAIAEMFEGYAIARCDDPMSINFEVNAHD